MLPRVLTLISLMTAAAAAQSGAVPLGDRTRDAVDVSFRPFEGGKKGERQSQAELSRLLREDKRWVLTFERAELPSPTPLRDTTGFEP